MICDLGVLIVFFFVFLFGNLCFFSFKKNNNNAQGGGMQSRANVPATVNSATLESSNAAAASTTPRPAAVQNGSHVHPQLHGMIYIYFQTQSRKLSFCCC